MAPAQQTAGWHVEAMRGAWDDGGLVPEGAVMADVEGAITCAFMPPSSGHTRVAPWRKPSSALSRLRYASSSVLDKVHLMAVGGKKHLLVPAYTKTKQLARRRGWVGMSGVHTGSACKCLRAENESSDDLCVYCVYCVSTACLLRVYCVSTACLLCNRQK